MVLTDAPWLIVVFKRIYDVGVNGNSKNYYVNESVNCLWYVDQCHSQCWVGDIDIHLAQ